MRSKALHSKVCGLEQARQLYAPPATYRRLFGRAALEEARFRAFADAYALARSTPGLADDLRAGLEAGLSEHRQRRGRAAEGGFNG